MRENSLEEIDIRYLQSLIDNSVPESVMIDYKRTLSLDTKENKKEFLKDITAFTNTLGGRIFYGIDEEKGAPTQLCGFSIEDSDALKQRINNILLDGVEPRVYGVQTKVVSLDSGKSILIINVPRSFNPPHMVTIGGHRKFYGRNSSGCHPLSVDEIRQSFLLADAFGAKARDFRAQRLSQIEAEQTPVPLMKGPKFILHLIPFDSFKPGSVYNLSSLESSCLPFIGEIKTQFPPSYNFDGLVSSRGHYPDRPETKAHCYTQCFRNGIIESIFMQYNPEVQGSIEPDICVDSKDAIISATTNKFLPMQKNLSITPPVSVCLSILGTKDHYISKIHKSTKKPEKIAPYTYKPIDRDNLILPEILLESFEADFKALFEPVFEIVLNAAGLTYKNL